MKVPLAIDPIGCGCTECITGEYIPLDRATVAYIDLMIAGIIRDNLFMSEQEFDEYCKKKFGY